MAYVDDIVAALGNTRPNTKKYAEIIAKEVAKDKQQGYAFAIPTPAPEDTSRYAKIIAREAAKDRPQVVVTDESYAPNGLLYTRFPEPSREQEVVEDILVPGKPNIDWNEPQGVSYAGGFGLGDSESDSGSVSIPVANDAISASADAASRNAPVVSGEMPAVVSPSAATAFAGDEMNLSPARQRRSNFARGMMGVADLLQISASRPNLFGQSALQPGSAYLGMTEDAANKYDKIRMEEDPEGKEIDINRAKVLSQRAASTDDENEKRKYGAAIKELLPRETQGLDDLTASGLFTGDTKLEIEKLKAANQLKKQEMIGAQKMDQIESQQTFKAALQDVLGAQALEQIAAKGTVGENLQNIKGAQTMQLQGMKGEQRLQQIAESNKGRMALQEAKFAGLEHLESTKHGFDLEKMAKKFGYDKALQQLKNDAKLAQLQITSSAKASKDKASPEEMKRIGMRTSAEFMSELKKYNDNAGRWSQVSPERSHTGAMYSAGYDYTSATMRRTDRAKSYQLFEGLAKQLVQDQLRKIYGAAFAEKEGERFFMSMGLNPMMDSDTRWKLTLNAVNDIRIKNGYEPLNMSAEKQQTASGASKKTIQVGQIKQAPDGRSYRFKGGDTHDANNWEVVQ